MIGERARATTLSAPRFDLRRAVRLVIYAMLLLAVFFYVLPVYVLLITSLKSTSEVTLDDMWRLPTSVGFTGFQDAWTQLEPNFLNSVKVAVPAAVISSMIGSINGYILAKWRFPYANLIFTLILFGMFIPYQATHPAGPARAMWALRLSGLVIIRHHLRHPHHDPHLPTTCHPRGAVEAAKTTALPFRHLLAILPPLSVPSSARWW